MSRIQHSLQHAGILAVGLLLAMASMVIGAAGDPFILGSANNSGTSQSAIIANSTFPLHGLVVQQGGTGNAGYFVSQGGSGVLGIAKSGNRWAMSGTNDGAEGGSGGAIIALGKNNTGLRATSEEDTAIEAEATGCTGFLCGSAGIYAVGTGLSGGVIGEGPLGVFGIDSVGGGGGFGFYTNDDAHIGGDLDVTGTCTGCTAAVMAVNGGSAPLAQGDAVTILGVVTDAQGNVLLRVGPATAGSMVVGVADTAQRLVQTGTADSLRQAYKPSGTSAAPGAAIRIITSGIVTFASADATGGAIAVGDSLAASSQAGRLTRAGDATDAGSRIGYALGTVANGRVAVFVDPH